jgi:NAD(P)-dependent dehydrogenase (short-subunit alcohol dehydrogenase family)
MDRRLEGTVAVVTGAGSGIGRTIAEAFHRHGARVVVADISGDEKRTAEALGDGAVAVRADVTVDGDVRDLIHTAVAAFGTVDILCNNAGIDGDLGPLGDCSEVNFDRVLAVNLKGVFLGMRHAIPVMVAGGGGSIINIASAAGLVGVPGMGAYCASKAGVIGLTRSAAVEYAPAGVRINAICPGPVDTPLIRAMAQTHPEAVTAAEGVIPMGRLGRPEEIAAAAVFLASRDASYLTGVALPTDGGYTTV